MVRVPNVYAWVCPEDGEASFTPETTDEILTTVRELLGPAKRDQITVALMSPTSKSLKKPITYSRNVVERWAGICAGLSS